MQLKANGAVMWKIQKDTGTSPPARISFSSSWLAAELLSKQASEDAITQICTLPQERQHPLTGLWGDTKSFPLGMKSPKSHP